MTIHDNVAFLYNGIKDDTKEVVVLLTNPSPMLVALHQLIYIVNKVAKHAIFLD